MKTKEEIISMIERLEPWGERENIEPYATYQDGCLDALDWVLETFADSEWDWVDEKPSK